MPHRLAARFLSPELKPAPIVAALSGDYSIEFATKAYFDVQGLATFFPKAVIHFSILDAAQHYHIPLLISPFAYSTYRGS